MKTRFRVIASQRVVSGGDNLYIYHIPECDFPRLDVGDYIHIRRFKAGYPLDVREEWTAVIRQKPELVILFSREDPDRTAYDVGSVSTIQNVEVEVVAKRIH